MWDESSLKEATQILKQLPRSYWQRAGYGNIESVAAHSCAVALRAVAYAMMLKETHGAELDYGLLALLAILHDLPEVLLGDLGRDQKELLGVTSVKQAEREAQRQVAEMFPDPHAIMELFAMLNEETPTVVEAAVVHKMDEADFDDTGAFIGAWGK